jgi:hypothetical protein
MIAIEMELLRQSLKAGCITDALQHSIKNYKTTKQQINKAKEQLAKDLEKAAKRAGSAGGGPSRI